MTSTHDPAVPTDQTEFGTSRAPSRPELIAPGSALHRMLSDASIAVYSLPVFLLPLLHPATAEATNSYDPAFTNPVNDAVAFGKRLWNTIEMVSGVVYADGEQDAVATSIRELHRDVRGQLPNGDNYHAWTRDIWTWNWAAIVAGIMDVYGGIRGFPDDAFRDEAYLGLVEVGRRFGVIGMPTDYPDFETRWPTELARTADPTTAAVRRVAALTFPRTLERPAGLRFVPVPLWDAFTLPVRHCQQVAIRVTMSAEHQAALGLTDSRADRRVIAVHRVFWRLIPRTLSRVVGLTVLHARHRRGTPAWRSRFSPETLTARHPTITAGRRRHRTTPDSIGPIDPPSAAMVTEVDRRPGGHA